MNIPFGKYISSLLKEHECVVLPGIGALLLKQKPSHISNGQIFPSSKTIHFNRHISTNDDLITSKLLNQEGLSFLSAKHELNKFISHIKFDLYQKGYFDIDSLGRFKQNEGIISFVSNTQIAKLHKNNFGFNSLSVFEIQREIISDKKELIKIEESIPVAKQTIEKPVINKTRKLRKSSLVGLAATFLLMITIASLMFTKTSFDTLKVQNANVLNFLAPSNNPINTKVGTLKRMHDNTNILDARISARGEFQQENPKLKGKKNKKNKETTEAPNELKAFTENIKEKEPVVKEEEKPIESEKVRNYPSVLSVNSENPEGFYVVIGAYSSLANANKAKYECSIENACSIFKTESGMYRVGIYTSLSKEIAIDIVTEYKKTNSSYWLMENK